MILTARSNDLSDHNQDLLSFLGLQYNFLWSFFNIFLDASQTSESNDMVAERS